MKRKRTTKKSQRSEKRAQKLAHRRRILEYYEEGTSFGDPVTHLLYTLAAHLGRETLDFLWFLKNNCRYGIVGLSSHYVYGKCGIVEYTAIAATYKEEVDRLTINTSASTWDLDAIDQEPDRPSTGGITFLEDLQLMLVRHWNLYDSMFHSTYVATKLGVWKERGRQRLTNLLVKMGYIIL